jgi:AmmeMemoRadiSam system protein A
LLLQLARNAIGAHAAGQRLAAAAPAPIAAQRAAAFVTLHHGDELRGCIGHLAADEPFSVIIPRCAIAASSEDPRFPAVSADEVPQLTIELSILGPLEPIHGPSEIEIGRHGLVVEQGWHRGLLLPQVATERQWTAETFLAQTCHKAGLPLDAWKHGATLWRFDAEVFGEDESR